MLISRKTLLAVLPATTSDDRRYFLQAVHIEPSGACVATDGHVLIKATTKAPIPDEDFPAGLGVDYAFHGNLDTPINVPADTIKRLIGGCPKKETIPALCCVQIGKNGSENTAVLAATDLKVPIVVNVKPDDDQTFPAYDRVIPTSDPSLIMAFRVDVIESILKTAKAVAGAQAVIRFDVPEGSITKGELTGAVRFTVPASSDVDLLGVAMCCRI